MSLIPNKIYKSIVLQPGEQFILPPGAVLVSSTNIAATQSSCNDLSNLEELECYTFVFGNAASDGNQTQLFEAFLFPAVGFRVGGAYYSFDPPIYSHEDSTPKGQYDLTAIISTINAKTGGVLINPTIGEHNEGDHGIIEFITFRTIPSLATSMELVMRAATPNDGFNEDEYIELSIKPRPTSQLSNYSGLPGCI